MERRAMLANTYGIAMPAKMDIESQILSKQRRLPGLPSSRLGLEILTGDVDRFGFDSYLDLPATDRTRQGSTRTRRWRRGWGSISFRGTDRGRNADASRADTHRGLMTGRVDGGGARE